jgi:hypothetical protein
VLYEIELDLRDITRELRIEEQMQKGCVRFTQPKARPVRGLEDLILNQYAAIICSRSRWSTFAALFLSPRELVESDMTQVNELRNTVFHFRRQVTTRDTDRMQRFRDKLRLAWQHLRRELAAS